MTTETEYIRSFRKVQSTGKYTDDCVFSLSQDTALPDTPHKTRVTVGKYQNHIPFFSPPYRKMELAESGKLHHHFLRSVNFYFTDVSKPSHISIARSIFILPTSRNRHSSSYAKQEHICSLYLNYITQRLVCQYIICMNLPQATILMRI